MTPLPPSRVPITLKPHLPTMFILSPRRNIRRADYLRRLRILRILRIGVGERQWFF